MVRNQTYSWDNLREYALRTAFLMKTMRGDLKIDSMKEILHQAIPKSREEIQRLVERIQTIPKEECWFIIPEEIVNFPTLLKLWHDFFLNGLSTRMYGTATR